MASVAIPELVARTLRFLFAQVRLLFRRRFRFLEVRNLATAGLEFLAQGVCFFLAPRGSRVECLECLDLMFQIRNVHGVGRRRAVQPRLALSQRFHLVRPGGGRLFKVRVTLVRQPLQPFDLGGQVVPRRRVRLKPRQLPLQEGDIPRARRVLPPESVLLLDQVGTTALRRFQRPTRLPDVRLGGLPLPHHVDRELPDFTGQRQHFPVLPDMGVDRRSPLPLDVVRLPLVEVPAQRVLCQGVELGRGDARRVHGRHGVQLSDRCRYLGIAVLLAVE